MHNVVPCIKIPVIRLIYGFPLRHRSVKSNTRKPGAIKEGSNVDARHAVGDSYARKSGATPEGSSSDARHAVGEGYARKPGAT